MDASIVIRTFNEEEYLPELLEAVHEQESGIEYETVIVDSGSTDGTLEIAERFGCRVVHISKSMFTFGRSLNLGCHAANGGVLVFVSGHCVPCDSSWLSRLIRPIVEGEAQYSYGRQLGRDSTKFSEHQVFEKYYPLTSKLQTESFFCNNANAAVSRDVWSRFRFDETLTGLEDMMLAKHVVADGGAVAYVAEAPVFHIHNETWHQVRIRYEREALALREIMPEVHVGFLDFIRYFVNGAMHDIGVAMEERRLLRTAFEITAFRWMQFLGTYLGNLEHRQVSARQREEYFYPRPARRRSHERNDRRSSTHEGA